MNIPITLIPVIIIFIGLSGIVNGEENGPQNCGYQSCNPVKEGFINVHIVPHSHDDVGWLKTVDQYYYGTKNYIQNVGVQYIVDSVLGALQLNPARRFIWVEGVFFWMWWQRHTESAHRVFKELVNNGQMEMTGGGWSMNDEATTHYQSIIDQLSLGLRTFNETLGPCGRPKIGWQIDPFGHSREMASIFAQLGYDGFILNRIDYKEHAIRKLTNTTKMVWQGSDSLGVQSQIFTSILHTDYYSSILKMCLDSGCSDDPIIDDRASPEFNADRIYEKIKGELDKMYASVKSHHLFVPMGGDFQYQAAHRQFASFDNLISYANSMQGLQGSKYNFLYSTPSCYIKAVRDSYVKRNKAFYVKTDDFFPYSDRNNRYWTGYFTSRPTFKRYERLGNNLLQVCKQLNSLADVDETTRKDMDPLKSAMGIVQHHDAISGTAKQHVSDDYSRLLGIGFDSCQRSSAAAMRKLTGQSNDALSTFQSCLLTNVTECRLTETSNTFIATIYNPLSRSVNFTVRLPVTTQFYAVLDPEGHSIPVDTMPIPRFVKSIPGSKSASEYELVFRAENLPPLGFRSYYIQKSSTEASPIMPVVPNAAEINPETGTIKDVNINNIHLPLRQEFLAYEAENSGAYAFITDNNAKLITDNAIVETFDGEVVSEIHQQFKCGWISQIIRTYKDENFVEFDWIIGPLPQEMNVVIRYNSKAVSTNSTFFTDANGREMLTRVRDFRPTWPWDNAKTLGSKYYPITTKIAIQDHVTNVEIAVLTDRAQGGTSLKNGQIELMVHRKTNNDDDYGVNEPLSEKAFNKGLVVRGSHYFMVGPSQIPTPSGKTFAAQTKDVMQRNLLKAWTFLSSTEESFEKYKAESVMEYSGLTTALPENVQILTLEPWSDHSFILRLEHVFALDEDANLSVPVKVNLETLFSAFKIIWFKETTLGGNQWLEDSSRMKFPIRGNLENVISNDDVKQGIYRKYSKARVQYEEKPREKDDGFIIVLTPMQIRTFIIKIKRN